MLCANVVDVLDKSQPRERQVVTNVSWNTEGRQEPASYPAILAGVYRADTGNEFVCVGRAAMWLHEITSPYHEQADGERPDEADSLISWLTFSSVNSFLCRVRGSYKQELWGYAMFVWGLDSWISHASCMVPYALALLWSQAHWPEAASEAELPVTALLSFY